MDLSGEHSFSGQLKTRQYIRMTPESSISIETRRLSSQMGTGISYASVPPSLIEILVAISRSSGKLTPVIPPTVFWPLMSAFNAPRRRTVSKTSTDTNLKTFEIVAPSS